MGNHSIEGHIVGTGKELIERDAAPTALRLKTHRQLGGRRRSSIAQVFRVKPCGTALNVTVFGNKTRNRLAKQRGIIVTTLSMCSLTIDHFINTYEAKN